MERILVAVDDSEAHRALLAEAGRVAQGTGADIVAFSWMSPEDFEEGADAIETIERIEGANYSDPDPLNVAHNFAEELVADVFEAHGIEDVDIETVAVHAEADGLADEIINAAAEHDCDNIYIVGKERSPTGKAIFGDIAQRVILNFDGLVTVNVE